MFTSVDSNRKKLEHPSNENVQFPQSLNNSIIKESKSGIANRIDILLSQNDEYTKLQLTIFGITFIVSILLASITGIFLGFTFGFSILIGAIAGIFYLRLLAKSIGKLGRESSGVSKLQLLVPVCLFIFASKLGSLDIFPAITNAWIKLVFFYTYYGYPMSYPSNI